jgi:hypothetical protein
MKPTLRILAVFLLLFLGFGAIYGGLMLISDPSGGKFEWSLELLNGTPFKSFLIPGIILLIANGLFPIYIAVLTLLKKKYAASFILIQGVIVIIWLSVQLIMNPGFFLAATHYPSFSVGILLFLTGLYLRRKAQGSYPTSNE